jgi:hypothetical protein
MTIGLIVFALLIGYALGFVHGNRKPPKTEFVRDGADPKRFDFIEKHKGGLVFAGGYWSLLLGEPQAVKGTNVDMRVAIDNAIRKETDEASHG